MFLLNGTLVYSASDLSLATDCEFALLSRLDEKLGRRPALRTSDPMRERAAQLGDEHEARVLAGYQEQFGTGVVEIALPERYDTAELNAQAERTLQALRAGADVVFQGGFFDGRFHGRSDFLVRDGNVGAQPRYAVVDTKLARSVKPAAVLQLAAYADQLLAAGIPLAPTTRLHLGDGTLAEQNLADSVAVYREHRAYVQSLLDGHLAGTDPVAWGDERYRACLWCDYCREAVEATRDVKLVWGLRARHRTLLRAAGITTIDELAVTEKPVPTIKPAMWAKLSAQAQLQLRQEAAEAAGLEPHVFAEVHNAAALQAMPAPDAGDVFFDFEGDPLWVDEDRSVWGIEYLFGLLEGDGDREYVTFWAHDRAAEGRALRDFLDYLQARREQFPALHVYHYAAYETATLRRLAARHGTGEAEVEDLIAAGVFVDLYQCVKDSVQVSQRSYSIKKLEPLYMGAQLRRADGVTSGGDSVVAYARAGELREAGDLAGYQQRLDDLADYNRYDCLSTLRLRDWLLAQRESGGAEGAGGRAQARQWTAHAPLAAAGFRPTGAAAPTAGGSPAAAEVVEHAEENPREVLIREVREQVAEPLGPLLAAALDYHRRENEPYWQDHFARLNSETSIGDVRDVLEVFHARRVPIENEYGRVRQVVDLAGRLGTGSTLEAGSEVCAVYEAPVPEGIDVPEGCDRAAVRARVLSRDVTAAGLDRVRIAESIPRGAAEISALPILLTPGAPPRPGTLTDAIELVARTVFAAERGHTEAERTPPEPTDAGPTSPLVPGHSPLPAAAAVALAAGAPPSRPDGRALPERIGTDADGTVAAVTAALMAAERTYLAVQGPPGTGKTYLGGQVIADLVLQHRWRIGVVAQSHAVVEHLLRGVIAAGVPGEQVGKRARVPRSADLAAGASTGADEQPWIVLDNYGHPGFLTRHRETGAVLGGTAWDFANRRRFEVDELDLLVIDEAGQFSLANTFAVATAARRLLLLGDPQQLPQVSQGDHLAPVATSALGWLARGHATLPASRGYLLEQTRRLHPALCKPVSDLYYDGQLHSHPTAAARQLEGLEPGLHVVMLDHHHRTVDSPEESAEVVAQIESLLDRPWTDGGPPRGLAPTDILVVAAYNAQVQRLRHDLNAAGLADVRVGTVDKFQGQQAAVVLVSMAASSTETSPRGLGFLLSANRLNVAISRAQWATILLRSRALTRSMPGAAEELRELGGFIELCQRAHPRRPRLH